uniref:Uncharacterized protein n=1 Tax=Arundo donax TaxID=35708 RepID=A0A0A8XU80_ARUDO
MARCLRWPAAALG